MAGYSLAAPLPEPRPIGRALRALTYKRNTRYDARIMGIVTVRLTENEERMLTRRARLARMKRATFIRMLIREEPLATGADVLADARVRKGDVRLRVSPKL